MKSHSTDNEFSVYLTFDIDQDFNPSSSDYYNRSAAKFDSFNTGFLSIVEQLSGKPFSVFIRSDNQINQLYGGYDYLVRSTELIKQIKENNGELDWHIHLYEKNGNEWVPISQKFLADAFLNDLKYVKEIPEINWHIVRIGECVMTNELMRAIDKTGVLIDSTAISSRKRDDAEKSFDWANTTNEVFNPSVSDYRVKGEPHLKVREVPMSTILMKAPYDKEPLLRYFNLAFKTDILFQNFSSYVEKHDSLVTITHPFEVISSGSHGLIAYDINTFHSNIEEMVKRVEACGKTPVFKKMSDLL